MWSSIILVIFNILLVNHPTKALNDEDASEEQHGNHTSTQPRITTYSVDLNARGLEEFKISTPRFPRRYPPKNQEVQWKVKAFENIRIECSPFKLSHPEFGLCIDDYLEIKGGTIIPPSHPSTPSPPGPYPRYCGTIFGFSLTITPPASGEIDIIFRSISRPRPKYKGFSCTIRSANPILYCGEYTPPIDIDDKIVGGNTTVDNQYPWQAVMVWNGTDDLRCGGSLINDRYVLTAAHCTYGYLPQTFQILLGVWCWSEISPEKLRLDIIRIIEHSGYNDTTFDNDISLLKLEDSIKFKHSQFRPVCLPISNTDPIKDEDDVEAAISGFGDLESGGASPDCLQYAIVPTMTNALCQLLYGEPITKNMICAGFPGIGGIDSCQGDSGGPMVANATSASSVNYYVQIGVVSWGYGCAEPEYPGVYARVSEYITWINDNTKGARTLPPPN